MSDDATTAIAKTLGERIFGPLTIFGIFAGAGTIHLVKPEVYEPIVPPPLPPREIVLISGVAEIVGGVLYLAPRTRKLGAWYLIALLLAVFPSNVYMARQEKFQQMVPGGKAALYARLPIQFLGIWWVRRLAKRTAR